MVTKEINLEQFETLLRQADCVKVNGETVAQFKSGQGFVFIIDTDGTEIFFDSMSKLVLWMGDTSTFIKSARGTKIDLYEFSPFPVNIKTL